ncbi:hypothetical protein [Rhizorhabdus histidinilytica]|uniref:hypothetical protein n=1 Tax=Rhizorhabdus histidinilytica TaxID=439228 RepID=UPI00321F6FB9
MANPLLTWPAADARRRIHIRSVGERVAWSFSPREQPFHTETIGAAVEEALAQIGHEDAVIIYEGRGA